MASAIQVLATIQLNNQPRTQANKIRDKFTQRNLPPKLESSEITSVQQLPKLALRVSLVVTECSRELSGFVCHHTPHPNPLPQGERGQIVRYQSGVCWGDEAYGDFSAKVLRPITLKYLIRDNPLEPIFNRCAIKIAGTPYPSIRATFVHFQRQQS